MTEFEEIYSENRGFIFKYLLGLSRDASVAEELTQETFFRAYINFSRLREKEKAAPWLCSIARNTFFAWYKERKKTVCLDADLPADCPDVAERVADITLAGKAAKILSRLDEPYRGVFKLSVFAGVPLNGISTLYGKSESWARVTLYRAKKMIRERMKLL